MARTMGFRIPTTRAIALILSILPAHAAAEPLYERLASFVTGDFPGLGRLFLASDGGLYGTTPSDGPYLSGSVFVLRKDAGGAWVFTTLHSFTGDDGRAPGSGVIEASDGNFYGTTLLGGAFDRGTVFKMTPAGAVSVLHSFSGPEGAAPRAALVQGNDDGLYGVTSEGGAKNFGTLFKVALDGSFTSLHSIESEVDRPSGLTLARDGFFYGAAARSVIRMTADGVVTLLGLVPDFWSLTTGLVEGRYGDLYGLGSGDPFNNWVGAFKMSTAGDYTFLHRFLPEEGRWASGELVQAPDGPFYGAMRFGGAGDGEGTIFRMDPDGAVSVLLDFADIGAAGPSTALTIGSGGLVYGRAAAEPGGLGIVFELDATATLSTVHTFSRGFDSFYPYGDLLLADDGHLYGTNYGYSADSSIAFRMSPSRETTVFHRFAQPAGRRPAAGLIQARDGNFYGTTVHDGDPTCHCGTVFKLSRAGELTTLHRFRGADGAHPTARLLQGSDGDFYGTTYVGGVQGCGTVFKMTADGALTTVHSFPFSPGSNAGCLPWSGLIEGSDGNFYGTTLGVGGGLGIRGNVYRITPGGQFRMLHAFDSGESAIGGLVEGSDGRLYGTTNGPRGGSPFPMPLGTVFALSLDGTITTLQEFHSLRSTEGTRPWATLVEVSGFLYGTTAHGGANGVGTVFRISSSTPLETLHHFSWKDGAYPAGRLAPGPDGWLYGTTVGGGDSNGGVVFRIKP